MSKCPECNKELQHKHDCAYGMTSTHMAGSERFECSCGFRCSDPWEGERLGLVFVLDVLTDIERDMYEIGLYDSDDQ